MSRKSKQKFKSMHLTSIDLNKQWKQAACIKIKDKLIAY